MTVTYVHLATSSLLTQGQHAHRTSHQLGLHQAYQLPLAGPWFQYRSLSPELLPALAQTQAVPCQLSKETALALTRMGRLVEGR